MHPSFIFALGIFCVYLFLKDRSPQALTSFFISTTGTLFNPYGFALHESIFSLAGSDFFMNLNHEWRSIDIHSIEFKISCGTFLTIILGYLFQGKFKEKLLENLGTTLLFLALFHSVRFLPYYAIFAVLPLAENLSFLLNKISSLLKEIKVPHPAVLRVGLVLTFFVFIYYSYNNALGPTMGLHPDNCTAVLKEVKIAGSEPVVLASPNHGGFLILNGLKPIIDDRNTMLGEAFYKDYFDKVKPQPGIFEYMEKMNITHAILSNKTSLADYILQDKRYKELDCKGGSFRMLALIR